MARFIAILTCLAVLAGCATSHDVDQSPLKDLGDFQLGHNIVVASKMQKVPVSRDATEEEWVTSLTNAFARRFERYEGTKLYHFGISVESYALAPPGVPLVATPKSAVLLKVTVWDDSAGKKLNEEPHQLFVFESFGEGLIVGSGYTNSREEQLENLSFNAAAQLENWLSQQQQEQAWFGASQEPDPTQDGTEAEAIPEDAVSEEGVPGDEAPETTQDAPPVQAPAPQVVNLIPERATSAPPRRPRLDPQQLNRQLLRDVGRPSANVLITN